MLEVRVPIFTINKDIIKKTLAQTSLSRGETSHSLLLEMVQVLDNSNDMTRNSYKPLWVQMLFWGHFILKYGFGNIFILILA